MKKNVFAVIAVLFLAVVSCMMITVNIYFPEKDVKEAYKALEKELMTPERGKPTGKPEGKPESSIKFEIVPSAYAQEPGLSDKIAEIVRKMPDVVNAYKEMGARIGEMDKMRDKGAVGEGKDGMISVRDEKLLTSDQKQIIAMENANRRTVTGGMARAIIRINRVPENEQNLNQVMPQAVEQFAAIRRDSAKKGWWVQSPDGNWTRK
ncbi:MAG: hypothetical protein A2157_06065 [Deltaproteobacteria bacterium RBG_16_47_11]|nr:MAG: hypothetical protein A2157_06065 [Deltaproteobacteria bacterium RBG_16_47_11]